MFDLPKNNLNFSLTVMCKEKKNGTGIVFIQLIVMRKPLLKTTGVNCLPDNFVKAATDFKYVSRKDPQHEYKNQQIKLMYNTVENAVLEIIKQYGQITPELAKIALDNKYAKRDTLLDFAKQYVRDKPLKPNTVRRYQAVIATVIEKYYPNTSLVEITPPWLQQMHANLLKLKYKGNTIWTIFKFVKSVVNFAIDMGVGMNYPFGAKKGLFKMPTYKNPDRNFLSTEQIDQIKTYYNSLNVMQRNVARWFVLQIYLGCRASDLQNFSLDKIKDNRYYITDVKTENQHYVPLYPKLVEAIENLEGPMYAYTVYNREVKAIGIDMKLPFALTTHVARHTFAVQWINFGGRDGTAKAMMGISLDKTFAVYKKLTNQSIDDEAGRIFGK